SGGVGIGVLGREREPRHLPGQGEIATIRVPATAQLSQLTKTAPTVLVGRCARPTQAAQQPQPIHARNPLFRNGLKPPARLVTALPFHRAEMYQAAEDRGAMPPSFVLEFAALLALGPVAALPVSALGALIKRRSANGVAVIAATAAASYAHHALGGTTGAFAWPFQGAPIGAAVLVYTVVKVLAMQVVTPLVTRKPVNRAWPRVLLRECPTYVVGAG